jgi:hypothetical protein
MSQVGMTSASTSWRADPSSSIGVAGCPTVAGDDQTASPSGPTASSCRTDARSGIDGTSSPTTMEEDTDDDLLDYEPSPAYNGMEVNVLYLSSIDYSLLEEEEVSQLALESQDAVFKRPTVSEDHLKPLYIHGHLDGTPVACMLLDGGTAVNVMRFATFKKLGKTDAKLVRMNMMLMGIGGEGPIGPKGVTSMELTIRSNMIPHCIFRRGGIR